MKDRSPILVVIGGPTASGKTAAAVALAKQLGTEVISADSRQFYRAMRIGTARPDDHELEGVPHHLLGHLELTETWSAGTFVQRAEPILQDVLSRHGIAIVVGGSGLYIDALTKGFDPLPPSDPRLRERLAARLRTEGMTALISELERLDPATWRRIDRANPHRVLRALEICLLTGRPLHEQHTSPPLRTDLTLIHLVLEVPREALYARIDARVDRMVVQGLVEEARGLLPYREHNALRTVGYRELFAHFDGAITLPEAIALIKQHTRNYAKRQLTWSRRDPYWTRFAAEDHAGMLRHISTRLP